MAIIKAEADRIAAYGGCRVQAHLGLARDRAATDARACGWPMAAIGWGS